MINFKELNKAALEYGFSEIELTTLYQKGCVIKAVSGEISEAETYEKENYTLKGRIIINGEAHMGMVTFSGDMDNNELFALVKENACVLKSTQESFLKPGLTYRPMKEMPEILGSHEEKEAALKAVIEACLKEPMISGVPSAEYQEEYAEKRLENSFGLSLKEESQSCLLFAEIIAQSSDDIQTGYDYHLVLNDVSLLNPIELAKKVSHDVSAKLNSGMLPSGQYHTVIQREALDALFMAFKGFFSGENALRSLTPLKDQENKALFNEQITIVDDAYASIYDPKVFDDEGMPTQKTVLVDHGIFKGFLDNKRTAEERKTVSTGNGYNGGVDTGYLRILPGDTSFDDLIKTCGYGVLITELNGLHAGANPLTGDYNCQANGFYIQDGLIGQPLHLMVISGNIMNLLKDVWLLGSDLKQEKDGHTPSILLKNQTISGK